MSRQENNIPTYSSDPSWQMQINFLLSCPKLTQESRQAGPFIRAPLTAVSRRTFSANLEHYGITVTLVTGLQDAEVSRGFGKEVWGLRWGAKLPLLHSTHSQIARVVSLETITQNGAAPRYCYCYCRCARTNLAVQQGRSFVFTHSASDREFSLGSPV